MLKTFKTYASDLLKIALPIILGNLGFIMIGVGDVVAVKETDSSKIKELVEAMGEKISPKWLEIDKSGSAKVVAMPERDDIDFEFNEQLIIELYSK